MCSVKRKLAEKVVRKKQVNGHLSHNAEANALNGPKSTVTHVLRKFDETLSVERRPGSGRKKGFAKKAEISLRGVAAGPYVGGVCPRCVQK